MDYKQYIFLSIVFMLQPVSIRAIALSIRDPKLAALEATAVVSNEQ